MSLWRRHSRFSLSLFFKFKYMKNYFLRNLHFLTTFLSYLTSFYRKSKKSMTTPSSFISSIFHRIVRHSNVTPLKDDDTNETKMLNKLANGKTQMKIILWKNGILLKSSKCALLAEILFSLLFALVLLLLIMKIDPIERSRQSIASKSVLKDNFYYYNRMNAMKDIYFYPNNEFVKDMCVNAIKNYFSPSSTSSFKKNTTRQGKQTKSLLDVFSTYFSDNDSMKSFNFIGANVSDANELSFKEKTNMFAFISFDFLSKANLTKFDEDIKYSIYTTE